MLGFSPRCRQVLLSMGRNIRARLATVSLCRIRAVHPLVIIHTEPCSLPKVFVFQIILKVPSRKLDIIFKQYGLRLFNETGSEKKWSHSPYLHFYKFSENVPSPTSSQHHGLSFEVILSEFGQNLCWLSIVAQKGREDAADIWVLPPPGATGGSEQNTKSHSEDAGSSLSFATLGDRTQAEHYCLVSSLQKLVQVYAA